MKYALLAYNGPATEQRGAIRSEIAEALARPSVTSWVRLQPAESATTLSSPGGKTLLTDGPFVDSKEYLGGLIIVEAANLDEALAVAAELQVLMSSGGAIEVRPILEEG
ncbi:MAG TPA: YciI family protein [Xanthobacteraceae bacterium]